MSERPNLGQILTGLGRIDEDDVARALEHQRRSGGYFGEALLALNLVSKDELEWGLASQFDLPYIFPDADSIDPEAAALVTPEWALAHLTMPILRTAEALTVVVDSPMRTEAVEELAARSDRPIELALASGERIRQVIQQVYSRVQAPDEATRLAPVSLSAGLALVLEAASGRFGVAVRQHRAWFWYQDGGTVRRRRLEGTWEAELDRLVTPPPSTRVVANERARFRAHLNREGVVTSVDVEFIAAPGGREYLFRPIEERSVLHERFPPPTSGLLAEIRLIARSGSARFLLVAEPAELGPEILPHLPALLLDPAWRGVHLSTGNAEAPADVFQIRLTGEPAERTRELENLRDFGFDAVTADLTTGDVDLAEAVADVAAVAFLLLPPAAAGRPAFGAGVHWELRVARAEGGRLTWSLQPLRP
jgi:hypothetical protein